MDRVPGFQELLQGLSPALTAPSVASLCTLVSGWLFSGRGIVTRMIVAAGSGATKHFSSYHGLLSAASWSLDAMGLAVLTMIRPFLGDVVMLGLDDTLARKRGLRMFLPLLFRLYVNRQTVATHGGQERTRPELGVEMLRILCAAHENRRFHVVADSAYGGQNVRAKLPGNCDLTSRLLLAARLYDARPERVPGTNGRPRKRATARFGDGPERQGFQQPGPASGTRGRHGGVKSMPSGQRVFVPRLNTVTGGGAHAPGAGMCRQAKQGLRSAVCIRVSEGHAGTDPRSGLVAQRTSGDGAWAPPTYATGTLQCVKHCKSRSEILA